MVEQPLVQCEIETSFELTSWVASELRRNEANLFERSTTSALVLCQFVINKLSLTRQGYWGLSKDDLVEAGIFSWILFHLA